MDCSANGRLAIGRWKLMMIGLATPTSAPLTGLKAGGANTGSPVNGAAFWPLAALMVTAGGATGAAMGAGGGTSTGGGGTSTGAARSPGNGGGGGGNSTRGGSTGTGAMSTTCGSTGG